jgi:hypothetical protein
MLKPDRFELLLSQTASRIVIKVVGAAFKKVLFCELHFLWLLLRHINRVESFKRRLLDSTLCLSERSGGSC